MHVYRVCDLNPCLAVVNDEYIHVNVLSMWTSLLTCVYVFLYDISASFSEQYRIWAGRSSALGSIIHQLLPVSPLVSQSQQDDRYVPTLYQISLHYYCTVWIYFSWILISTWCHVISKALSSCYKKFWAASALLITIDNFSMPFSLNEWEKHCYNSRLLRPLIISH